MFSMKSYLKSSTPPHQVLFFEIPVNIQTKEDEEEGKNEISNKQKVYNKIKYLFTDEKSQRK